MQLIGYMDSPFVRRVAVSMQMLGIDYEHRELSIFRDFEEFRTINPLVKVPTLVLNHGQVLVDSTLIINYLEAHVAGHSLLPPEPAACRESIRQIGVALVAMEKVAGLIYETGQRPAELQYPAWIDRLRTQLRGAIGLMEASVAKCEVLGQPWLSGDTPGQSDISTAIAWRFVQFVDAARMKAGLFPALESFSVRAEALPEFLACPLAS